MGTKQSVGTPSVAIAHDYLTQRGGAERVVLTLAKAFPDAPIYTTLYSPDDTYPEFADHRVVVSWLNRISLFRKNHRLALPLLPLAAKSLKSNADVLVVSSSAFAHGARNTGRVLVYCHTPPRFLYLSDEYLGSGAAARLIGAALKPLKPLFRWMDRAAANRADRYVANSSVVRKRIDEIYGFEADLVFPPHAIDLDGAKESISDASEFGRYSLLVSRLLPYKNVDKVVEAFRSMPEQNLLIVGAGPLAAELRASLPPNVKLVSGLTDAQMRWAYSNATFLIAPSFEDFGLTVVEGAAWGLPAITLGAGGYLDTVVPDVTGVYFQEPTAEAIVEAFKRALGKDWDRERIRAHAGIFSEGRFIAKIQEMACKLAQK